MLLLHKIKLIIHKMFITKAYNLNPQQQQKNAKVAVVFIVLLFQVRRCTCHRSVAVRDPDFGAGTAGSNPGGDSFPVSRDDWKISV